MFNGIGAIQIIVIGIIYTSITFYGIFLAIKNETSLTQILWILSILIFPFIGPIIYFFSLKMKKKSDLTIS